MMKNGVSLRILMAALLLCTVIAAGTDDTRSLGDLTGPWQLFLDDYLIQERSGVARRYHPFEKHAANPVLKPDQPWEGEVAYLFGSVLPNESRTGYRMWYHTHRGYRNLYATSEDGVHWIKPKLGIAEFNGSRANNIFIERPKESHLPIVIHTPWDADPNRHYKLIYYDYGRTDAKHPVSGFYGAYSADGVHWSKELSEPVLPDPGDIGNFVWDPNRGRYIGYAKIFAAVRGFRRRSIGFTSTRDFEHWPPTELILAPDEVDDRWVESDRQHTDFYGLAAFPYESMYLGFLWVFRISEGTNDGPIHLELVSSRDGIRWKRQEGDRPPILALGPSGSWDGGMLHTATQPVINGDTIHLFYGASDQTHESSIAGGWGNCAIGLATLRKDGFASLDAGAEIATITTRPIENLQGGLRLNANAGKGWIKVEILDDDGEVVPGFGLDQCQPLKKDGLDQPVSWENRRTLPPLKTPRRIRFQLQNASLYAFRADQPVRLATAPEPLKIFLDFENDGHGPSSDKAVADGRQTIRLHHSAKVIQDKDKAAHGLGVLEFGGSGYTHDALEILDTKDLGEQFTLAVKLKTQQRRGQRRPFTARPMRLFSSYRGTGKPTSGELIFDFDPRAGSLRFIWNGQTVSSRSRWIQKDRYYHLAATYDRGHVELFLDGENVGAGDLLPGTSHLYYDRTVLSHLSPATTLPKVGVHLGSNLQVGQDLEGRFITHKTLDQSSPEHQLFGLVDDILVQEGPPEFPLGANLGEDKDFIQAIGKIQKYGVGGAWGKGGWARSFQGPDGSIYLQGDKKSTDGGKTFVDHNGPSFEEILRIPEGVIHNRPGLFYAVDGAVDLKSPDVYTVRAWRSTDGLRTLVQEESTVRIPGGPRRQRKPDEWYGFYFYRNMLELPDGTLLTTMEGNLEDDKLKPNDRRSSSETVYMQRTIIVTSRDEGRTWDYLSTVAAPVPGDPVGEGFDEPTILRLNDGRILCVMRTGHFSPLYACWSSDDGKTWTEPKYTGLERGCDPHLLLLQDGRILLSYGERFPTGSYLKPKKRGALVKFALSDDGGEEWRVATVAEGMGSSYSTILEVEPNLIFCQVDGWFWRVQLKPRGF